VSCLDSGCFTAFVALGQRGALFFNELLRATGRLASEVELPRSE
jgi:hypothetical protein